MRKKPVDTGRYLKLRIYIVLGFFFLLFAAIFGRAFQLQVVEGGRLKNLAQKQHRKTINIQSKRGDIYDRNLKELAVSIEVDSVFAQPGKIDSPRAAAMALSPVLAMSASEIEKKIKSQPNFVWLKRQVDLKDEDRKIISEIEGMGVVKEARRYYPNRQLASNIIGFTGLDSNGLEGVERYYDSTLKGASRKFVGDKDAMGRLLLFEDLDKTVPVQGMEVELTIDKTVQYIAEKALKKAVDETGAKGGTALVMDPATGEMLAMASLPTFDPNDIKKFEPRHWRNKNITDAFEPGSTFKLFLISAALEENVVKPKESIYCENGSYRVADRVFHDHEKYGWLTVPQIMKVSSNIGSAKIGERLGRVQLHRYLKAFGFGGKTGIDLPGEATGSLRHHSTWSGVTVDTVSFGQGVAVTGIQLVSALSTIANGGFLMKPYVVRSVKDSSGAIVSENNPVIVRKVISEDTAKKLTDMLVGVTEEGGTGTNAALDDFEVAGKTGTAQKPDLKNGGYMKGAYLASFMGFAPARAPRLAILVTIDEPKGDLYYGGQVAAPAFKEIAEQSLSYMGVFPDNRKGPAVQFVKAEKAQKGQASSVAAPVEEDRESAEAEHADSAPPMSIPDFSGKTVRMVLKMARDRAFDVEINGSGTAYEQRPAPGQPIPAKGPVVVSFQ